VDLAELLVFYCERAADSVRRETIATQLT
jgi:hypothetical protein